MVSGLIVICGPTASGKSGLALRLAQRLQTVIVSADSRQVYREFNIGTAKPTATELAQVPHYLIDICDPTETLTLADYQQQAQAVIDPATSPPLLVGGTGLYIKAIAKGLKIPRVPPHPELRSQLQSFDQSYRYGLLQHLDPDATQKIHPNDATRTIRALEVFYVTGFPISQQQGENPPTYPIMQLGLDCDRLDRRIQTRTAAMVDQGLIPEVEALCERYGADLPLLKTLGYAEVCALLRGDLAPTELVDRISLHTRQFAKRQRTWFRAYPEIHWFDADHPDLFEQVWQWLNDLPQACDKRT
jgi:tRNA dimethylallyltransferase